jgi:ATP synthase protein I
LTGADPVSKFRAASGAGDFLLVGVESMADGTRDEGGDSAKPADEAALSTRLRQLGKRLDAVGASRKAGNATGSQGSADPSAMARGLRLSAELVGGVIVGAGLGLGLDYLLGSSPWGFIVLLLLGFAGGVLSVMRSAGVIPDRKM